MSGNVNQRPNVLNLPERVFVPSKKTVRAPMPKKRSKGVPLSERVSLERVLGLTVRDNRAFTCDSTTGLVVYPAGCVIVLFNPRRNKQSHIFNHSRKTITAVAISSDGTNVVSGECGHKPAVRVWDVEERTQLAELHGHKFGINCVAFSPNLKYVVSVGEQHDMVVNVWNWKDGSKHAAGKISVKVADLAFSEDGSRFVTAGNRSIKFWYISSESKKRETLPLNSRSGLLGEQRNNYYCSLACGLGANHAKTYAVTRSGLLCEFTEQRLLDKWVELRTTSAYCIIASQKYLFVGCADGIVRLFDASTLNFVATLPRPHHLGVNVSDGIDPSHVITHPEDARYPATIAITYDDISKKITCVYNDHSLYVWDVHDIKKIGKQRSFLYHSSCIWGAEVYPILTDTDKGALPSDSFLTYSSDDTIRIWNVDPAMNTDTFKRNIYSNELLKVIYTDEQLEHLCNMDSSPSSDKIDTAEGKNGIRCVSISCDGQFLASGDRSGNVRLHDMQFMDEVQKIEAHDAEVLCLEFSRPESGYYVLASASRDRLIHVFNVEEDCSLVQTLDDHSSSITSVKFTQSNGRLQMVSCGADKALMFRVASQNPEFEFVRNHHVVGKTTLYDLAIDPTEKYVATACQDRNIRIHNTSTGKLKRTYKGSLGEDGTLIKVELDPSGMYIATSCSDKTVAIFDFYSGECVATMDGHSELVTGIKFTNDCKHLISTSGDGCIFVWRLPWGFTHNMKERLSEMGQHIIQAPVYSDPRRGTYVVPPELNDPQAVTIETGNSNNNWNSDNGPVAMVTDEQDEEDDGDDEADWEGGPKLHSTTELPLWAKKQVCGEDLPSPTYYSNPAQPRGRWAQRLDSKGFKVKSEWDAHRDIELKLEDAIDRRRYTVEPDIIAEQVRQFALLHSTTAAEPERNQSLAHVGETSEFVSAEEGLAGLEDLTNPSDPRLQDFVTCRGSDPFLPPTNHQSDLVSPDTLEDVLGQAKEEEDEDDDESNEEIIIYPPNEETNSSPEGLKFQVTENLSSLEELQRRRARSVSKKESPRSSRVLQDEDLAKAGELSEPTDPVSLGPSEDEDEDDIDDEAEDDNDDTSDKQMPPGDNDASITSSSEVTNTQATKPNDRDSSSFKDREDETQEDEESFLHTNYCFTEQEKFGKCLEQLQSSFASGGLNGSNHRHRLSISSKFLSRSQLSSIRSAESVSQVGSSSVGAVTAQVYLQRRKDVMAKAVDETRRRLQSMGWNSWKTKPSSTVTPTSSVSSESSAGTSVTVPATTPATILSSPQKSEDAISATLSPQENNDNSPGASNEQSGSEENSEVDKEVSQSTKRTVSSATRDKDKDNKFVVDMDKENEVVTGEGSSETKEAQKELSVLDKNTNKEHKEKDAFESMHRKKLTDEKGLTEMKTDIKSKVYGDDQTEACIPPNIENSTPVLFGQSERVLNTDDQSGSTSATSENIHIPIIKGKKPVSAPGEASSDANPDRSSSKSETHQGRRTISSNSKSKMDKMKARKDPVSKSGMRKTTSMTDLSQVEGFQSDSPSSDMVLQFHPRSHSVERSRMRASSPARDKYRARSDRVLPIAPGVSRPKSYEVGTTSSRAKVTTRKDNDTPPSSPPKNTRGKRASIGALGEGSKQQPKSAPCSPEILLDNERGILAAEQPSAKEALADKAKQQVELVSDLQGKTSKDKILNLNDRPRSSSPSSVGSQNDIAPGSSTQDQADRLAMPPPTITSVAKANRNLRRSSAARMELREQRRRSSSLSKTPSPVTNDTSSRRRRGSVDSGSTPETSQTDSRPSSPRNRSSSYRENRSSALRERLSPKAPRKALTAAMTDEPKDESQEGGGPSGPKNINVQKEEKSTRPSPRRRRRERNEALELAKAVPPSQDRDSPAIEKFRSPRSRRRRSFKEASEQAEESSTRSDKGSEDKEKKTDTGTNSEQGLHPPQEVRVPSPDLETAELIFDMMKVHVDTMKTAFDQCLELCTKAQEGLAKGKSHQHSLDYFATTFSRMQSASNNTLVSSRQAGRHHLLNRSVTDDTMSDLSESSLPYDDLLRSTSSGIAPTASRLSGVSSSDMEALRSSLMSCHKAPPNGITTDVETTSAIALLDQYSNILVSLVKQKIGEELSEGSAVTQTQRSLDAAL